MCIGGSHALSAKHLEHGRAFLAGAAVRWRRMRRDRRDREVVVMEARATDDDLRAVIEGNPDPRARLAAEELLELRSARRRDSRRAEQVRRLRWTIENSIMKIEEFMDVAKQWEAEEALGRDGLQP